MNLASFFETLRQASVEMITDCFAISAEIGVLVVVHPDYYALEQEKGEAHRQFKISEVDLRNAATDLLLTFWFET